ncbi:MAG: glycosyltransferase family 2 protein [Gammaproteobacteria bacterium]|nr:glycosyltransferase family 2 protein [Gammaproteobacteria bacterium]
MRPNKISIVLCTYNGEKYLPDLLSSIQKQSLPPAELVWVDDRSKDNTIKIAKEFAQSVEYPVKLFINESQLGPKLNFSLALSKASGDFIALCDQDDVWLPHKLETLCAQFTSSDQMLAYSNGQLVDSKLRNLNATFLERNGTTHKDRARLNFLLFQNSVTGCFCMFRRDILDFALPIPQAAIMHDWWIAQVASAIGKVIFTSEITTLYRQHDDNVMGVQKRYSITALKRSGFPFKFVKQAQQNANLSVAQILSLKQRLEESNLKCPPLLKELCNVLNSSKPSLLLYLKKNNIQRGDFFRNMYLYLGLLTRST